MSKINDTLVMMADPNAKPVEVVLEKIYPDYSHLVGNWKDYWGIE